MDISSNLGTGSFELKKHVALIHCHNQLTLLQKKISNALLFNARSELLTKEEHSIHIGVLSQIIGYDSKDFARIKSALVALASSVIEWNLLDKSGKNDHTWVASAIISDASIQGAVCTYSYSKRMRELLIRPDVYGRIDMRVQSKFKSVYALILYENCIRYQGVSRTPWLDLGVLRKIMGVSEEKYQIYRDFKKRVIDIAIEEVNKYSPLQIALDTQKNGRETKAVQFLITKKQAEIKVPQFESNAEKFVENEKKNIFDKLTNDFGITKKVALELLEEFSCNYIFEKINIILSTKSFLHGKINSLGAYLVSAIKNNYIQQKSVGEFLIEKNEKSMREEERNKKALKKEEKTKEQYREYLDEHFDSEWSLISQNEQHNLFKNWVDSFKENNPAYFKMNKKIIDLKGLSSIMVKTLFRDFLIENRPDIYSKPKSFECFQEEQGRAAYEHSMLINGAD